MTRQAAISTLDWTRSIDIKPLILHKGKLPQGRDHQQHQAAYQENQELYALSALSPTITTVQRERILFQLLRSSRVGMSPEVRRICDRVVKFLTTITHPDRILTIFLALRRVRANHKHTSRTILNYILNHPDLENMANCRRPTLVDCLEHGMGRNVARACAKMLINPEVADQKYLHRHLWKFTRDRELIKGIFPLLYGGGISQKIAPQYQLTHTQYLEKLAAQKERPKTITATNRGDISATLVHLYRGGKSVELQQALTDYVEKAAQKLPKFEGKLAIVLDASASTRGYGEREYCCISQSVAWQLVLEKAYPQTKVYPVGGTEKIPIPQGSTDLASALVDALLDQPDLVAIISDGYENIVQGDLGRVVATLPQIGIETPIVFCHSKFTNSDDLSLRQAAPNLPQLEFWHENDFESLLISLAALARPELSASGLREFLLKKLAEIEQTLAIG